MDDTSCSKPSFRVKESCSISSGTTPLLLVEDDIPMVIVVSLQSLSVLKDNGQSRDQEWSSCSTAGSKLPGTLLVQVQDANT